MQMDAGQASFRISSARLGSSSIWRNNTLDVFARSSREDTYDDDEALTWAAIEKLPTYLRVQRGMLTEDEGQAREVDIKNLGFIERRNLIERLLKIAEEDNEKFLLKLKDRIERYYLTCNFFFPFLCAFRVYTILMTVVSLCLIFNFRVGLDIPTIEVRFEHLNVEAEAYIGSRALPTVFNSCANMLEVCIS